MSQGFLISKIQTENFRNLSSDIFEFTAGINCIFGDNGQGKTNVLESIYFLTTGKSFRKKATFPQLISIDSVKPEIIISGLFFKKGSKKQRTFKINKSGYQFFNDGVVSKKKEKIPTTFIAPFDAFRFFNENDFKRYWFDTNISVIDLVYAKNLKNYQKHIRNRNKLLSLKPSKYVEQIEAIDELVAPLIRKLVIARKKFVEEMNGLCTETFFSIFSSSHSLKLDYKSKYQEISEEEVYQKVRHNFANDLNYGFTKDGPHREKFELSFDGFDSQDFCSIGQQKMAFISLVFAYIELFRYKFNSYPLLLIDDISGELDKVRWHKLLTYLCDKNIQILITTANKEFEREVLKLSNSNRIHINSGGISR